MIKEQREMVQAFKNTYDSERIEPFAIYGTGINAEAVISCCRDYPIVGVIDVAKTGEVFCGLPVLSLDEVLERKIRRIIVIARPSVHGIIYKRIQKWSEENGILVLDIFGNEIARKIKNRESDQPYFQVNYDALKRELDSHDVISFDVFDTLLMRKVYEPADVFVLMDRELSDRFSFLFSEERKAAEQELRRDCEPNIYQIYEYLAEKYHFSEEERQYLLSLELEKEKAVLYVREKMKQCMEECIRKGKKVYLVSDMYLPAEILEVILEKYGITGYTELLVSCDYQTSKPEKLFEILKEKARGNRYLHIGDQKEADYDSPKKNGMDAFLIMPAIRMMECSSYSDAFIHLQAAPSRVMLGMLAVEIFHDPFVLNGTRGRPVIGNAEQFGYAFIAPLILSFTVWMLHKIESKKNSLLLFSARDGWIIQKVFHQLEKAWSLTGLPHDIYFMVSRKALQSVNQKEEKEDRKNYLNYLKNLNFESYESIYYFDFMSRGTCQSLLEEISGQKMQGLYFQKSISGIASKDAIQVNAYFKESSAQDRDLRIFALCDFLECIFTSYHPSFYRKDREGKSVYETEKRTKGQLKTLREIHTGIFRYCNDFARIVTKFPEDMPANEFCDEILRYMSSEYSQVRITGLEEFVLDDWLGGDKNTGLDALR